MPIKNKIDWGGIDVLPAPSGLVLIGVMKSNFKGRTKSFEPMLSTRNKTD
jgi:hypothetical protein